jgi:hypothetical protein
MFLLRSLINRFPLISGWDYNIFQGFDPIENPETNEEI